MRANLSALLGLVIPSVVLTASGCVELPESGSAESPSFYSPQVAPTVQILSPSVGEVLTAGESWQLIGQVADPDGSRSELSATWSWNGEPICSDVVPQPDGRVFCRTTGTSGTGELALSVVDADGLSSEAILDVTVEPGPAPSISFQASDSQKIYSDSEAVFEGQISGEGPLSLSISSSVDGSGVFSIDLDDDGSFEATATLSEGEHVITATVTDGLGNTSNLGTSVYVDGPNTAPSCVVLAPDSDDRTTTGDYTSLSGVVDDDDVGPAALTVLWSSSVDGLLGQGELDPATGLVSLTTALSAGVHELTLTVYDEKGADCQDTISHVVGQPPTVSVTGPTTFLNEGDLASFAAEVTGAVPGTEVSWSVGGVSLGSSYTDLDGYSAFETTGLPSGENVVVAQVTDNNGWTGVGGWEVDVNGLPTAPELSGGGAFASDIDLVAVEVTPSIDPEGGPVLETYEWYINGARVSGQSGLTLPASETTRGDEVLLRAYGNDGFANGPAAEVSFTVENAEPTISFVSISPASPSSADPVLCNVTVADADGDAVGTEYLWVVDERLVGTGQTLQPGSYPSGSTLQCFAGAMDDYGVSTAISAGVTVRPSAPRLIGLHLNTAAADVTTRLSAEFETVDYDKDTVSVEYSWSVNGSPVGNSTELTAAHGFAAGDLVSVTVTPVDTFHRGVSSTASIVIGNAAPEAATAAFESEVTRPGDDLVCVIDSPAVDPDGDPITYSFIWMNGDEMWTGAVADTYEAGDTIEGANIEEGDRWMCVVESSDGEEARTSMAHRVVQGELVGTTFEFTAADLAGASDTCSGMEAVADGSLVAADTGMTYISLPISKEMLQDAVEVSVEVEAAACNAAEGAIGTFQWAIVDESLSGAMASGSSDLTAPSGCTCPSTGEVLDLASEVEMSDQLGEQFMVFTIDADSFGFIEDVNGNVVSVTVWK